MFSTIPTLPQRQGMLSVPVVHPFTGVLYPAGAALPLTDFARKVLAELPEPNVPNVASNNYQKGVPNETDYDKFNLRLDHKFSDSFSMFARVGQQKTAAFEAPNIDGPSGSNQNGFIDVLAQQFVAGTSWVIGPTRVFDARVGVSRMEAGKRPPVIGGPSMFELYGITGLPENDPTLTGGLTPQSITGYSQLGRQATNPQFQNPFNINVRADADQHPRPPQRQDRLRVSRDQHRRPGYQPALRARYLQQPVQPAGRRGRQQPVQPRRFLLRRAHAVPARQPDRRADAAAFGTTPTSRTTSGSTTS